MRPLSYLAPLLLVPTAALAGQAGAAAVSEPLTTDSLVTSVIPGGPIQTFSSTAVTTTDTETATTTATDSSLSSESTTNTALHPSEPTGISGGAGTGTGTGSSASATTTPSSEGAAVFRDGGSSRVALVVALGAGLLGWFVF